MKVPDGNKPIKIGDTSFIYKGVYHPIVWIGTEPYRPRVEMLVVKDGRYLYARLKDDIEKTAPDKRTHKYTIPGGSIDADSSKLDQAIAETNEEALIKVTLVYNSGVQYYDRYEPGFLLKGGDMPIEYIGSISDVFVGVYDGEYDKSKVEEKDLDKDMAENGKFHDITGIAKYLRREHIDALLHSQFVATDVKTALQLYRLDTINENLNDLTSPILIPGEKIYHGSTYEIDSFKPMSLDLGNAFEGPGWSTFCFAEYDFAKMFGAARAFTKMLKDSCDEGDDSSELNVEFLFGYLIMSKRCFEYIKYKDLLDINVKFYVYTIDSTGLNIGIGNDPALKEYTFRESNVRPEKVDVFNLSLMDLKELIEITENGISDIVQKPSSEYNLLLTHNYRTEADVRDRLQAAISNGKLKPGDDIEKFMSENDLDFDSDDIPLPEISVSVDEPVFEGSIPSDIVMEEKYPSDCYGLPERKAYPMPDEKLVRSAIRFFNYVASDEEQELADNINRRIQELKVKDINVGDKNRFKKYYKPLIESFNMNDFYNAMSECATKISNKELPTTERYKTYSQMSGLVRMLVVQLNTDVFEEIDDDEREKMLNQSYATLAEIAMNQTELLSTMESRDIRTLNLRPIMEAPEDEEEPETATDYTAMADAQEGGDDDGGESEGDTSEPEGVTDYTAMADEAGAEDDETPEEGDGASGEGEGEMGEDGESDDNFGDEDSENVGSDETPDAEENSENDKRYNNKEIKNYFLLNNFLSMHQTVVDVLDTVNGVVLPTPDANGIMAKVVKNLQSVKNFIEKFIQFQFSEKDYAFNLYYYNILMNALRMNLKLLEAAVQVDGDSAKKE